MTQTPRGWVFEARFVKIDNKYMMMAVQQDIVGVEIGMIDALSVECCDGCADFSPHGIVDGAMMEPSA